MPTVEVVQARYKTRLTEQFMPPISSRFCCVSRVESGGYLEIINHYRYDKMLEDLRICTPDPWIILSSFMKGLALHFDRDTVSQDVS
jgi:hypothetical protein